MRKFSPAFVIIIIFMAVSGTIFFFYVKAEFKTIRSLKTDIAYLSTQDEHISKNEPEGLEHLKELFPQPGSATEFIEKIYMISGSYNIDAISFNYNKREYADLSSGNILKALPSSGSMPKVISLDSIKINFVSDYRSLAEFIRELQNLSRLVTIDGLNVKNKGTSLAVEMVVNIYSMETSNAL